MKNIVIVNGYLQIGGAEKVLVYLANMLSSKYNISFIILRKSKKELFLLNENVRLIELNLEEERVSSSQMGVLGTLKYFLKTSLILRRKFKEVNANIVIAFNDRETILTWLALQCQNKIKSIFSQRNAPSSKRFITNRILQYIYSHSDGVVFQLQDVRNFYNLNNKTNCVVIENPITLDDSSSSVNIISNRILAAGRLVHQKRFDLLIDAFMKFVNNHKDFTLEIYGEGELKEELQKQIVLCHLKDKVFIKSPISEVIKKNSDSFMFVLCSDYEGIPNIVLEAMSAGIPCIVTDCNPGGGKLVTNNGECGLLIKTSDVDALTNAMESYANNISLRNKMVNNAKEYIKRFSEDSISRKWLAFIEKLLAN